MKFLVVDDEPLARRRISDYLKRVQTDAEIVEAEDGVHALEILTNFAPDLIFLDIEMPELNGFDLLMQLEARPFRVIFQTAYDAFAIRAFDANAVDYLLKPFSDERLAQALKKAELSAPGLLPLERILVGEERYLAKLSIRLGQRIKLIDVADVHYFLSESHLTRLFVAGMDYVLDHSLSFLEERLDPKKFVRTHRNSIVNLAEVVELKQGAAAMALLRSGQVVPVSRERKKILLKALTSS